MDLETWGDFLVSGGGFGKRNELLFKKDSIGGQDFRFIDWLGVMAWFF